MWNYFKNKKEAEAKELQERAELLAKQLLADREAELQIQIANMAKQLFADKVAEDEAKALKIKEDKAKAEEKKRADDEEEMRLANLALAEYCRKKKESDIPWMEIIQEDITADGVKITMDWNDAQIKFLRANGYTDPSDEIIIHQHLSAVSKDLTLTELAEDYMESSGKELSFPARGDFTEEDKELDEYVRKDNES